MGGLQGSACPGLLPGTRVPGRHLLQSSSEPPTAEEATAAPVGSAYPYLPAGLL